MNRLHFINSDRRQAINDMLLQVKECDVPPLHIHMAFVALLTCIVLALLEIADAIRINK